MESLLLLSKLKLLFQGLVEDLLSAVFHLESSNNSFFREVALNLYFGVLFPGSNTFWHFEFDLFFEEDIHLLLYGICFSGNHKSSCVINASHLVEIFMQVREATHNVEFSIENILSMTSILNTIIYNQLNHDLSGFFAVEREILSVAGYDIAILSKSLLDSRFTIGRVVLYQTLRANV